MKKGLVAVAAFFWLLSAAIGMRQRCMSQTLRK